MKRIPKHKLVVEGLGYVLGVCWRILRLGKLFHDQPIGWSPKTLVKKSKGGPPQDAREIEVLEWIMVNFAPYNPPIGSIYHLLYTTYSPCRTWGAPHATDPFFLGEPFETTIDQSFVVSLLSRFPLSPMHPGLLVRNFRSGNWCGTPGRLMN